MEQNWIHYDENHLMNTENGMIVINTANLKDIKPNEIKGFDRL
jgi:hypothetical protein